MSEQSNRRRKGFQRLWHAPRKRERVQHVKAKACMPGGSQGQNPGKFSSAHPGGRHPANKAAAAAAPAGNFPRR